VHHGLTDVVSDEDIEKALRRRITPDEQYQALADAAVQAGASDDLTVVIAKYHIPPHSHEMSCRKPKAESRKPRAESRKPKAESRTPNAERRKGHRSPADVVAGDANQRSRGTIFGPSGSAS
jgi:hypothetical protein